MSPLNVRLYLVMFLTLDAAFLGLYFLARMTGSEALLFLFNLDRELTLASWYASSKLLLVALAFFFCSHRPSAASSRSLFLIFAGGFVFLSADEAASIHEGIAEQFQYEGWFVIYGAIGLVLGAVLLPKLWRLWQHYRWPSLLFVVGFGLMVVGAVAIEELRQEFLARGSTWETLQVALEEGLELTGASLILFAALRFFYATPSLSPTPAKREPTLTQAVESYEVE
jgi:hypothetical protein